MAPGSFTANPLPQSKSEPYWLCRKNEVAGISASACQPGWHCKVGLQLTFAHDMDVIIRRHNALLGKLLVTVNIVNIRI